MSDPNVNVSSTPAVSDNSATPATATPVAPAQSGAPAISPTPTQTGTATSNPAPQVPPGYVPSFRIRETRDQYETRIREIEAAKSAEIARLTQQVQALTGVTPQNRSEEETIREQLYKVVPELKSLVEQREQLAELVAQRQEMAQQQQHYWQSYNRSRMDDLFKTASEAYGQPLSDPQKRYLAASFVGWAQSDPELVERYQSDPSLVNEFWKEFSSSFVEPARRIQATSAVDRVARNVPQDTPSGNNLRPSNAPDEPKDLDGKVDKAWQTFKQLRAK